MTVHAEPGLFRFDNTYARELAGFYAEWPPSPASAPVLLRFNHDLARELGLNLHGVNDERLAAIFAGNEVPTGATPIAQAYAGHQFGGFSPQLGDGRALLLGEVVDTTGQRRDIAFKGSGRTPFSRGGDGKATVGPVLREYLMGEAMHALRIPTTRALAAVRTGDPVTRERVLPGAVLTRVAASHVRVGTFEFFAARSQYDAVRRLADYVIARHYPELTDRDDPYLELLRAVTDRQASLLAQWMLVGFIHGVMNTDNMALSGETIDFGPCAFMEAFDPRTVFSSIDHGGRYAYGSQPAIAQWNLARFGETLVPILRGSQEDAVARATEVVGAFGERYEDAWLRGVRAKLGLTLAEADDEALALEWLTMLHSQRVDFTLAWRRLADAAAGDHPPLDALFHDARPLAAWLARWRTRGQRESASPSTRATTMRQANPIYIPRNQKVEEALSAASDRGDLQPFERLLAVITRPFDERPGLNDYANPAPAEITARYQTFCGT